MGGWGYVSGLYIWEDYGIVALVPVSMVDYSDCKRRCAGVALLASGMYGSGLNGITLNGVTHARA